MNTEPDTQFEDATAVFSATVKSFRDSLGPKEREIFKEYDDSKVMVRELLEQIKIFQTKRKLSALCKKVEKFAAAWEPFFEVTNIFVQTHPEIAGIAWGAIRLVFLLGTNFTIYLEKLVTMLERIGERLPGYEEYFNIFKRRQEKQYSNADSIDSINIRNNRVYKSLSYVYADILQFCQQACNIFGSKKGGIRYKASVIKDLFWKPFDTRFADVLDRLQSHRELFTSELQLEESIQREIQYGNRASEAMENLAALKQIKDQIKNLHDSNILSTETLRKKLEILEHSLSKIKDCQLSQNTIEERNLNSLRMRVTEIKKWVNAPEYLQEFEKACQIRLAETGEWLLESLTYKMWKSDYVSHYQNSEACDANESPAPKILFIQGKPGYGKTVLSSSLIEDLRDTSLPASNTSSMQSHILFYHFVSERRDFCTSSHAFRAILTQLVHRHCMREDVIDTISVLMDTKWSSQLTSSDDEVLEALKLLLLSLPCSVLVFDGIDECEDHTLLLQHVSEFCTFSNTYALVLGRSNVELPHGMTHLSLRLDQASNFQDITLFLEPHIRTLQERALITRETSTDVIVNRLATAAEGMFLWASLMVRFLQCRSLSPKERNDAIFEIKYVEGLDSLYSKILQILGRGYQKERSKISRILQLVAGAVRPMLITEIQTAIAISPGKATEMPDLIVDLKDALPVICGALVEVQQNDTVQFVHSSLRDFLTSEQSRAKYTQFAIDIPEANLLIANICLSYLIYDIPSSPLSGIGIKSTTVCALRATFRFLDYSLRWTQHAADGLGQFLPVNNTTSQKNMTDFFSLMATFANRPLTVTAWIEAAWTFGAKPSLELLMNGLITYENTMDSQHISCTKALVLSLIRQLTADLSRLHEEWEHLLRKDPSSIWGPSITAFCKSLFWYETGDTVVSSLVPNEALASLSQQESRKRAIIVRSQVSKIGTELGIVLVVPSPFYTIAAESIFSSNTEDDSSSKIPVTEAERTRIARLCSSGWKVRYQQRCVDSEELLFDFDFELPHNQVFDILLQCLHSKSPDRFPFPICFSEDLGRLVVLRSIVVVKRVYTDRWRNTLDFNIQTLDPRDSMPDVNIHNEKTFYSVFSPNAKALAFVIGRPTTGVIDSCRIQVWSEIPSSSAWPKYEYKGEIRSSRLKSTTGSLEEQFVFHPFLPLIFYPEWNRTSLWFFDTDPRKTITVIEDAAVHSMGFSVDGRILTFKRSIWSTYDDAVDDDDQHCDVPFQAGVSEDSLLITPLVPPDYFTRKSSDPGAPELTTNLDGIDWSSTQQYSLTSTQGVIHHVHDDGAVVAGPQLLAHLPRLQNGQATYVSMLRFSQNDKFIRLVWNKATQDTYSIFDTPTPHIPSIIYRRAATIQQYSSESSAPKRLRLI